MKRKGQGVFVPWPLECDHNGRTDPGMHEGAAAPSYEIRSGGIRAREMMFSAAQPLQGCEADLQRLRNIIAQRRSIDKACAPGYNEANGSIWK